MLKKCSSFSKALQRYKLFLVSTKFLRIFCAILFFFLFFAIIQCELANKEYFFEACAYKKRAETFVSTLCRGERIRTFDPLLPKQVR